MAMKGSGFGWLMENFGELILGVVVLIIVIAIAIMLAGYKII